MSMLSPEELTRLRSAESLFPSPIPVQSVSSDEFMPGPQTAKQREFEARIKEIGAQMAGAGWRSVVLPVALDAASHRAVERAPGPDPWPYGLEANRTTLEAFAQYAFEQGVCARRVEVQDLFPPEVQSSFKV